MHIGIDLGTSNTLVSYVNDSGNICKVEFKNGRKENKSLLPSCVAVNNGSIMVGEPALRFRKEHSDCVQANMKDLMGTNETRTFGRGQLSAQDAAEMILSEVMRELRSQFPEEKEFHAFVTVPACFDTTMPRQQTKDALKKAGFIYNENNALIDEPVAAAVAYSTHLDKSKNILVVDFGGGTFDLAMLSSSIVGSAVSTDRIDIVTWGGDRRLGGNDIDELLVKAISKKIKEDTGVELSYPPEDMRYSDSESAAAAILRENIIFVKKQLYSGETDEAELYISSLLDDYDLDIVITADEYRELVRTSIFPRIEKCIDDIIEKSFQNDSWADTVLVVGGMSRELCLCEYLREKFGNARVVIPEDSLYLVSRGAAICNSELKMHIDNKAYSSVGVLIHNLTDVDVIIEEGQNISEGYTVSRYYYPEDKKAVNVGFSVVEFSGKFDPHNYTVVFRQNIAFKKGLFKSSNRFRADFHLNKDNLLDIVITQDDGADKKYSVRFR